MATAIEVARLFSSLGLRIDRSQWQQGDELIARTQSALTRLAKVATAALAGLSFGAAIKSGLSFNANLEETRNQIAGMLALAKHTDLADQFADTDALMKSLQERAKKLPGSLQDYTKVLGMIAQPITDAGIGLKDLEDITVGAAVAAKSMNVDLEAAARDVNQAIMGQFHSVDQLTGRILGSLGYVGEAGRKRFNELSKAQRAAVLKEAFTQKQLTQLADAQSKSASGRWDTLKASIAETLGRVATPLFKKLSALLERANTWLEENKQTVEDLADAIGDVLVGAFDLLLWSFTHLAPVVKKVAGWVGSFIDGLKKGKPWATALGFAIGLTLVPAIARMLLQLAALPAAFARSAAAALGYAEATQAAAAANAQLAASGAGAAAGRGLFAGLAGAAGPAALAAGGALLINELTGGSIDFKKMNGALLGGLIEKFKDDGGRPLTSLSAEDLGAYFQYQRAQLDGGQVGQVAPMAPPPVYTPPIAPTAAGLAPHVETNITINPATGMSEYRVGEIAGEKVREHVNDMLRGEH